MNIFVLHEQPDVAAQMLCDKHVVKMILESAQMLCTVAHNHGYDAPYRRTHPKHPCTLWAGKSQENWDWLASHALAMSGEYTRRYGKTHKSRSVIDWCLWQGIKIQFPESGLLPFAQAMPPQYKSDCAVTAYRAYYHGEKAKFATWKSEVPQWWTAA
mgnify:FL=1